MQKPDTKDAVVAYTNFKEAALYFPYVIVDSSAFFDGVLRTMLIDSVKGRDIKDIEEEIRKEFVGTFGNEEVGPDGLPKHLIDLLPPALRTDRPFLKLLTKVPFWDALHALLSQITEGQKTAHVEAKKAEIETILRTKLRISVFNEDSLSNSWEALMDRYDLHSQAAIMTPTMVKEMAIAKAVVTKMINDGKLPGKMRTKPENNEREDLRLSLVNAKLIDTSSASWDQIVALREDVESKRKLERLRRFLTTNYDGKGRSFIEDDLQQRLEDHEAVAKKFGMETRYVVVDAVLKAPWVLGLGAGLTWYLREQQTTAALVAGIVATVAKVGGTIVQLKRRKFEFDEEVRQHPLGYIFDAKKRIETSSE